MFYVETDLKIETLTDLKIGTLFWKGKYSHTVINNEIPR